MFFLQHATGVASTKLTPTALRTLSGARSNPQELLKLQEENDENEDQISQSVSQEREIVEYDPKIFTTIEADMSSNLDDSHVYKPEEVVEILKLTKLDNTESITKGDQKEEESADDDSHHYVPLSKQRSFIAPNKGKSSDSPTLNPRVVAMSKQLQDAVRLSNEV